MQKLFSLHTALANETAGERGIYLESEGLLLLRSAVNRSCLNVIHCHR